VATNNKTRVLVIDDEAPIRLLCRVNLEAEGMEVLEASDGPSGLDLARGERPDVVLLDVMMPGLGGVDYVTKPFNPLELAPLVRELLGRIDKGERDELRGEKLAELRALMDND
jgi:DNA-binding response OmpR family regulator